jgi:hypothetical protein
MRPQPVACWICDETLTRATQAEMHLCHRVACRFAYQSLPPNHRCSHCRRPLTLQQQAEGVCTDRACHAAAEERRQAAFDEEHRAASQQLYQLARKRVGPEVETAPLTFLPSMRLGLTMLPPKRSAAFRKELDRLLAKAESEGWVNESEETFLPAPPTDPDLLAVASRGCTGCKGSCCTTGKTHAYVTIRTLRRIRTAQPGMTTAQIREAFLSRLGGQTYQNSCVFHGAKGCKLPVEIRSDTCNYYFCSDLHGFFKAATLPVRTVMAWPEIDGSLSTALVEPKQTRKLGRLRLKGS